MIRKNDLALTTPRYLFLAENTKGDLSPLWLTMDQVSDQLAAGVQLATVGESRRIWGGADLRPEDR